MSKRAALEKEIAQQIAECRSNPSNPAMIAELTRLSNSFIG